jgi:Subtilase family.
MKRILAVLSVLIVILFTVGGMGIVTADGGGNETGTPEETRVIVQLAEIESFDSKEDLKQQTRDRQEPVLDHLETVDGVTVQDRLWITNTILVTVDTDRVSLDQLRQIPDVESVELDEKVSGGDPIPTVSSQSTPDAETTYGLDQINAPETWERFDTRGDGVTIGVIDGGVTPDHVAIELNGGNSANNYEGGWHTLYYPNGSVLVLVNVKACLHLPHSTVVVTALTSQARLSVGIRPELQSELHPMLSSFIQPRCTTVMDMRSMCVSHCSGWLRRNPISSV